MFARLQESGSHRAIGLLKKVEELLQENFGHSSGNLDFLPWETDDIYDNLAICRSDGRVRQLRNKAQLPANGVPPRACFCS